jgi:hypothetical protein
MQENEPEEMMMWAESWGQNSSFSTDKPKIILNFRQSTQHTDPSKFHSFCPTYFRPYDHLQKDYFECVLKHVEHKE